MTFADMARVRDAVLAGLADSAIGGVIVAHGTDAMEETAFLTDLALGSPAKPVIFTGAMLPISYPGSDAPANLANAAGRAQPGAGSAWRAGGLWRAPHSGLRGLQAFHHRDRRVSLAAGHARRGAGRKGAAPAPARRRAGPVLPAGPCPILRWRVVTTVLPSRLHWTRAPRGWC
jgi:L-asparaginase